MQRIEVINAVETRAHLNMLLDQEQEVEVESSSWRDVAVELDRQLQKFMKHSADHDPWLAEVLEKLAKPAE